MKIILIGNYTRDRQQSMDRFAEMLKSGFKNNSYHVEIWRPHVLIGRFSKQADRGLGKWFGYVDKWILFSIWLWIQSMFQKNTHYHICDHSNAPYLGVLPAAKSSITCHDVLAIRGALGFADSYCIASRFGKILQSWILKHLSKAERVAAVSEKTLQQLKELCPNNTKSSQWQVILNGFNEAFRPLTKQEFSDCLANIGWKASDNFILHVGSNLPRKNRSMLLKMVAFLGDRWNGKVCFAGQPMNDSLRQEAIALGLLSRVVEVDRPDHQTLCALYSQCEAFVFPSYSEGFGWPVIEAQACGAVVIASNIEPMPEISGGAALHASPDDVHAFASHLLSLLDENLKSPLVELGKKNCERFAPEKMIEAYVRLLKI